MFSCSSTSQAYISLFALCAVGFGACRQPLPKPLQFDAVASFGISYRESLAEFRAAYPEALAAFKAELIRSYASLQVDAPAQYNLPLELDARIWKRLAGTKAFKPLPEELRGAEHGCPHGIYTALWEEIAAETDTSPEPENQLRRKAICNLYQYELAIDECSMPPGAEAYIVFYLPQASILEIPHPNRETGLSGCTYYVRSETLPPRQLQHIAWLRKAIDGIPADAPDRYSQKQQFLLEYYQRCAKDGNE